MDSPKTKKFVMSTTRLETLADGIFAIAMTLLILSVEAPAPGTISNSQEFQKYVIDLIPTISVYFLSFILLGSFWLNHHIFFLIKKTNTRLVWINILWLMMVVMVPFTTSLISGYGKYQLSELIFGLNLFLVGMLYFINIFYAYRSNFLVDYMRPYAPRIILANLALPILSLISIAVSFISPVWSLMVYLIVPILISSFSFLYRLGHKSEE